MHELARRFDPDEIERDIRASIVRRIAVRDAMHRNETRWDYQPWFDARRQYVRKPRS